jgi:DNA-binding LacI/PurR family transcriptional regulator
MALGNRLCHHGNIVPATAVRLQQVIITYKANDPESKRWAARCEQELEARGVRVLVGPSGPKDNPYPVFLASANQPIDLAIVLGMTDDTTKHEKYS